MVQVYNEIMMNKNCRIFFFPDDFGLRRPVVQKPFSPKKVFLYRSLRQKMSRN